MRPNDKAAMITGINQARQACLEEQKTYFAVIDAALAAPVTPSKASLLKELTWEDIEAHMAGERWPPASPDWLRVKGLQWDQTPKHLQLQTIKDNEVRFATYHFTEAVLHALRLKAAARFVSRFGVVNDEAAILFACWQAVAMHREIDQIAAATAIGSNPLTHAVPP